MTHSECSWRLKITAEGLSLQLEYAAAVWQLGKSELLDRVQRRGLAMCLGVPATASLEALQVEAGVLPLDLRREELAVRVWENLCKARHPTSEEGTERMGRNTRRNNREVHLTVWPDGYTDGRYVCPNRYIMQLHRARARLCRLSSTYLVTTRILE